MHSTGNEGTYPLIPLWYEVNNLINNSISMNLCANRTYEKRWIDEKDSDLMATKQKTSNYYRY